MQIGVLTERDLRLLHGLQIAPRASWAEAARILGATPAGLAARWERLRGEGLAWVTAHPSGLTRDVLVAMVDVECVPGQQGEAAQVLCADPRVASVEQPASGRDLQLTVFTPDLPTLSAFVLDHLLQVPGVLRQRTSLATAVHRQGSDWRLGALDAQEQAAFEALATRRTTDVPLPRDSRPLVEGLARDGRASAAQLARETGRNPATVRRQLGRLLASGALSFRCEVAQEPTLWPFHFTWLARVPPHEVERTVAAVATLPELRLCMSTTGETNLLVTLWTRSREDLLDIEKRLSGRLPWVRLAETMFSMRTLKRMGWMIDATGRTTGEVVVPSALG